MLILLILALNRLQKATYYQQWLSVLEVLAKIRRIVTPPESPASILLATPCVSCCGT